MSLECLSDPKALLPSSVRPWIDAAFENQETFYNSATPTTPYKSVSAPGHPPVLPATMVSWQIVTMLASLASKTTGIDQSAFITGIYDTSLNMATRIEWKYGCSRKWTYTSLQSVYTFTIPRLVRVLHSIRRSYYWHTPIPG